MCNEADDACLPAIKLVPDWFVTNKLLEKTDKFAFFNYDIVFAIVQFLLMIWVLLMQIIEIFTLMM